MKFSAFCGLTLSLLLEIVFILNSCSGQQYTIRRIIHTNLAPAPALPLSQVDNLVYVSGFLGTDANGTMMTGISNQTRMALENIGHVLREAQSSFANVIKTTVLLFNLGDVDAMNSVYGEYFTTNFPARMTYEVGRLIGDAVVEIDAVAIVGDVIDVDSK